jgi:hypothetical protein
MIFIEEKIRTAIISWLMLDLLPSGLGNIFEE